MGGDGVGGGGAGLCSFRQAFLLIGSFSFLKCYFLFIVFRPAREESCASPDLDEPNSTAVFNSTLARRERRESTPLIRETTRPSFFLNGKKLLVLSQLKGETLKTQFFWAGGEVHEWVNRTNSAAARGSIRSNGHTLAKDDQKKT